LNSSKAAAETWHLKGSTLKVKELHKMYSRPTNAL